MSENRTKISVSKKLNLSLNVLSAKLGMRKTAFLEALTKVPVTELKELLAKRESAE